MSDVEQRKQRSQNNRENDHNSDKTKKHFRGSYIEVNPFFQHRWTMLDSVGRSGQTNSTCLVQHLDSGAGTKIYPESLENNPRHIGLIKTKGATPALDDLGMIFHLSLILSSVLVRWP